MNQEIWKDVTGHEGFYMISNLGRVRSLNGRWGSGRILKPHPHRGYNQVTLVKDGVRSAGKVAHLVAAAFIGKPNGFYVCHNNGNPSDDRVENLRYDTQRGNCADKKHHGTHQCGENHGGHKLTESDVLKIRQDNRSLQKIADDYGVVFSTIREIRHGRHWKHLL